MCIRDSFLGNVFLENVVLDGARQVIEIVSPLLRQGDVHGVENPGGRIDGHGYRDLGQINIVEQLLHVGKGVDGNAFSAHLTLAHGMAGVVTHKRRHIEVDGQTGLALGDQVLEATVGFPCRTKAGNLAHGPVPAPIHGGVWPPRKRVLPRETNILKIY